MQPQILLSTGRQAGTHSAQRVHSTLYGEAVTRAGGIPAAYAGGIPEVLAGCYDGLLLTGGGDIAPERYGASRLPTDEIDELRDAEEFALLEAFEKKRRPIFGICRGIQLLNIYYGGTLYQHIPNHGNNTVHWVQAVPGSQISILCGSRFETNSWHHQAVRTLAPPLTAAAISDDGIIEALEHQTLPIFAVQWHPERMICGLCSDLSTDHLMLFSHFIKVIKECKKRHEPNQNC